MRQRCQRHQRYHQHHQHHQHRHRHRLAGGRTAQPAPGCKVGRCGGGFGESRSGDVLCMLRVRMWCVGMRRVLRTCTHTHMCCASQRAPLPFAPLPTVAAAVVVQGIEYEKRRELADKVVSDDLRGGVRVPTEYGPLCCCCLSLLVAACCCLLMFVDFFFDVCRCLLSSSFLVFNSHLPSPSLTAEDCEILNVR